MVAYDIKVHGTDNISHRTQRMHTSVRPLYSNKYHQKSELGYNINILGRAMPRSTKYIKNKNTRVVALEWLFYHVSFLHSLAISIPS